MILLSTFSLALAWRNNAHVRTCQRRDLSNLGTTAGVAMMLVILWLCLSQISPWFSVPVFFFFSGINSALSLSHQVLYKERDTRQVCYQNNISHTVYRPFNFTDFHGCHLSSGEPQVQMGTARRNSWLMGLFWQIPTPLARSNSKWSYPQKPLLNSKIFQNLLQKQ